MDHDVLVREYVVAESRNAKHQHRRVEHLSVRAAMHAELSVGVDIRGQQRYVQRRLHGVHITLMHDDDDLHVPKSTDATSEHKLRRME
jgi:hypothetical protein